MNEVLVPAKYCEGWRILLYTSAIFFPTQGMTSFLDREKASLYLNLKHINKKKKNSLTRAQEWKREEITDLVDKGLIIRLPCPTHWKS